MDNRERLIADAKRAARRLARTRAETYQQCLDIIAQEQGRKNWTGYLADPVDVRSNVVDEAVATTKDRLEELKPAFPPSDDSLYLQKSRANKDEAHGRPGEGIVLGKTNPVLFRIGGGRTIRSARQSTVICVGPPGSGKTTGVTLRTMATSPHASQVIHDCKSDLLESMHKLGIREHTKIAILNPFPASEKKAGAELPSFNPLHPAFRCQNDDLIWEQAQWIADVMIGEERGDYYKRSAKEFLVAIIALLILYPEQIPAKGRNDRKASLPAVIDWIDTVHAEKSPPFEEGKYQQDDPGSRPFKRALAICDDRNSSIAIRMAATFRSAAGMSRLERSNILDALESALLTVKNKEIALYLDPVEYDDGADVIKILADADKPATLFLRTDQAGLIKPVKIISLAVEMIGFWQKQQGPSGRSLQFLLEDAGRLLEIPFVTQAITAGAPPSTTILVIVQSAGAQLRSFIPGKALSQLRPDHLILMNTNDSDTSVAVQHIMNQAISDNELYKMKPGTHYIADRHGKQQVATPLLFYKREKH